MGTRALVVLRSKHLDNYQIYAILYVHLDGYPKGLGKVLYRMLQDMVIVNGIRFGDTRKVANGIGCLYAQIIMELKHEVGQNHLRTNQMMIELNQERMKLPEPEVPTMPIYAGGVYLYSVDYPYQEEPEEWNYYLTFDEDSQRLEVEISTGYAAADEEPFFKGSVTEMKSVVE